MESEFTSFFFFLYHTSSSSFFLYSKYRHSQMTNMCCCCSISGSGDWFRSIVSLRKKAKEVKVHSTIEKSNDQEGSPITDHIESTTSPPNGVIQHLSNGHVSVEYQAAIRIQTAFRRYMARKEVGRLKGAVRFNVVIQGNDTQKQASSAISCIHTWSYIQAQIKARRHHMVTEGRIKQRKLENQLKLEAKLQELEVDWCGGSETMEDILSRIQQREEAAVKRERAMAYAFTHQWRANPTQYLGQAYYSIGKENWGWSWKERWIAARPWEIRIQAQPNNQKKCHSRQVSKSEMKVALASKPATSNGKASTKAKKSSDPNTVDYSAAQEAIDVVT